MIRTHAQQFTRTLLALLLAAGLALGAAQEIDSRAADLLRGIGADATAARNMDVRYSTTTYITGEPMSADTRTVVDFENNRALILTDIQGIETSIVVKDGKASIKMMGLELPAPPGTLDDFGDIFNQQPGSAIIDSASVLTFDGPASYGELLSGDQVTYVGEGSLFGAPEAQEIHYIFTASGELLGAHMETEAGEMIMVYDPPVADMFVPYAATLYMLENGEWTLNSEIAVTSMEIDVTLDESLF